MTLTDERRTAAAPRTSRPRLVAEPARDDVFRIVEQQPDGARVVGYVQVVGPVYVTLRGAVYNTSIEIAQCLDLEAAIARLERERA